MSFLFDLYHNMSYLHLQTPTCLGWQVSWPTVGLHRPDSSTNARKRQFPPEWTWNRHPLHVSDVLTWRGLSIPPFVWVVAQFFNDRVQDDLDLRPLDVLLLAVVVLIGVLEPPDVVVGVRHQVDVDPDRFVDVFAWGVTAGRLWQWLAGSQTHGSSENCHQSFHHTTIYLSAFIKLLKNKIHSFIYCTKSTVHKKFPWQR